MRDSKLRDELERLEVIIKSLRIIGLMCAMGSFFNLCMFLWLFMMRFPMSMGFMVNAVILFFVLAGVVYFEILRKRGDAIFEELSDELQWYIRDGRKLKTQTGDYDDSESWAEERPTLNARIVLRTFSRTTDLPLVPGRFGPAIYAGINLLIFMFTISVFLRMHW